MAMSDEERRAKNRERQKRFREARRAEAENERAAVHALPRIGPDGRGSTSPAESSNEAAAIEFLGGLVVPPSAKPHAALLLTLARDLDSNAIAQRSALAQRYDETMDKLVAAARPVERDELDELRRAFYGGGTDGIDDDPEAPKQRTVRKKA